MSKKYDFSLAIVFLAPVPNNCSKIPEVSKVSRALLSAAQYTFPKLL